MDHDCVSETRAAGAEPLAALFGRWEEAESPWAAGGDRAKRRLCRGLTTREADALRRGEGLTTRQHSGRDADHAASIADHRGSDGRGLFRPIPKYMKVYAQWAWVCIAMHYL